MISRKSEGLLFRYAPEDKDGGEQSHYSSLGVSGLLGGQSGPLFPVGNRRMARRVEHEAGSDSLSLRERVYGIDLYMETYGETGEVENDGVWFQLKATENTKPTQRRTIPIRLEWRDLLYWLNEWGPGILVIYDAALDQAWWLHLQRALRAVTLKISEPPAETMTFHIPLENILDEAAIREFAKLRDAAVVAKGEPPWFIFRPYRSSELV